MSKMKSLFRHSIRRTLVLATVLTLAIPVLAAAATRHTGPVDVCVRTVSPLNVLVFQDVPSLTPGRSIELHGTYFSNALQGIPFDGSAAASADGTIRIGLFVHSSAFRLFPSTDVFRNDFTLSGVADGNLAGTFNFDNDGDYLPNGALTFESVDCATVTIP
jgi:hypothetical protein